MGRSPCCEKVGLKKGPWTPEEDQKLLAYIEEHGHGSWRALPAKAGLQRCGKSCRLRWTNYLRPDIKRGKFNLQEEQAIIQLHALLGNRWSAIATHLPKRTDNEIKNYWNTHLKKRLAKMGIDPVTHQPKNDTLFSGDGDGHSKAAANLSHMAQWERARLEAEARLVRQSKLRRPNMNSLDPAAPASTSSNKSSAPPLLLNSASPCLDILKAWSRVRTANGGSDLHSLKSTLSFFENVLPASQESEEDLKIFGNISTLLHREGSENSNSMIFQSRVLLQEMTTISMEGNSNFNSEPDINGYQGQALAAESFTDLLLCNSGDRQSYSEGGGDSDNGGGSCSGSGSDYCEDNKNYWNNILNLVNSSPSHSPMF